MKNEIIPIEVKRNRRRRKSLNAMLTNNEKDTKYIKWSKKNKVTYKNNKKIIEIFYRIESCSY